MINIIVLQNLYSIMYSDIFKVNNMLIKLYFTVTQVLALPTSSSIEVFNPTLFQ